MQDSVSVEQLGQQDLVAMSSSLGELLVNISPDTLFHVPDSHQERIQSWIDGNRLMPRLLIPYLDEHFLVNDFEPRDLPFVAEELDDACRLVGIDRPDISGLDQAQVEVLLNWIDTVHMQSHVAFKSDRQPVFTMYPAEQLAVTSPVAAEVANPFAEPEPVQAGPDGDDDIVDESSVVHPMDVISAATEITFGGEDEPEADAAYDNETRAEAKVRLEEEMHYAKVALITLTGEHEAAKEEAKFAKARMTQAQVRLNEIVQELDDVNRDGDWQPRLPLDRDSGSGSSAKDPAITAAVHELAKYGATEKQCDKLVDAQIETITELESRIASGNPLTKIKGIGQALCDSLCDALMEWRKANGYGADD
jgi:hypothetical protein